MESIKIPLTPESATALREAHTGYTGCEACNGDSVDREGLDALLLAVDVAARQRANDEADALIRNQGALFDMDLADKNKTIQGLMQAVAGLLLVVRGADMLLSGEIVGPKRLGEMDNGLIQFAKAELEKAQRSAP